MIMKYLHTMVRITNIEKSLEAFLTTYLTIVSLIANARQLKSIYNIPLRLS